MEFEWDERKRLANIDKHGFDFIDVWELFAGDNIRAGADAGAGWGTAVSRHRPHPGHPCHRHRHDAGWRDPRDFASEGQDG